MLTKELEMEEPIRPINGYNALDDSDISKTFLVILSFII